VLTATDHGTPPLSRYERVVLTVDPVKRPVILNEFFAPPRELAGDFGVYRSPLKFADGAEVKSAGDWVRRRAEILEFWHRTMGAWPSLLAKPRLEILKSAPRENFTQHRVRVEMARDQFVEGWLLVPAGRGPFPAVLVPFYEPETGTGLNSARHRDFALQLTRRGFVTLSIGSPGGDARRPDPGSAPWQPLSFLAYIAANCHTVLTQRPEVDPQRIGIVGHSYGGKWAMFAASLYEKFACCVTSDPGIVWDEARPNVNYWEPWYLGRDPAVTRKPGILTPESPRTGAYRELVATGHDLTELHALLAPRPFLVSGGAEDQPERWRALNHLVQVNRLLGVTNRVAMTNRATHDPNPESNAQIYEFFERFLQRSEK
jgi:dienelactone hydrolase